MGYRADFTEPSRVAGTYVGRILRGEKRPAGAAGREDRIAHQSQDRQIARPNVWPVRQRRADGPFPWGNSSTRTPSCITIIPATTTRTRGLYRERSDRIAGRDQYPCGCVQYAGQYR
jgi:hypothetical protein